MASNTRFSSGNVSTRPSAPAFGITQGGAAALNPQSQNFGPKSVFGGPVNTPGEKSGYTLSSPSLPFKTSLSSTTPIGPPPTFPGLFSQKKTIAGAFGLPSSLPSTATSRNPLRNSQQPSGNPFTSAAHGTGSLFGPPKTQTANVFGNNGTSIVSPVGPVHNGLIPSAQTPFRNSPTVGSSAGNDNMFNTATESNTTGTQNSPAGGGSSGILATTPTTSLFGPSQVAIGNNNLSHFVSYHGKTGNAAPATSSFAPMQAQLNISTPISTHPATSFFAPAQAKINDSNIGRQLAQLADIAKNRSAVDSFGPLAAIGGPPLPPQATTLHNPLPVFAPPTAVPHSAPIFTSVGPPTAVPFLPSTATSVLVSVTPIISSTSALPMITSPTTSIPASTALFAAASIKLPTAHPTASTYASTAPATASFPVAAEIRAQSSILSSGPQTQMPSFQAAKPPQKPRVTSNKSLEEIVTCWSIDLEAYKTDFIERASEVKKWDDIIVDHMEKITNLTTETISAEKAQRIVDNMLDQLESDQEHLEKLFDYYEASLGEIESLHSMSQTVDTEREIVFNAAVMLNDKLAEMGAGAGEMIKALNDASAKVENTTNTDNPLFLIVKILNDHLSIMQWVDEQTAFLTEKIENAKTPCPVDNGVETTMHRYYNEHMGLRE